MRLPLGTVDLNLSAILCLLPYPTYSFAHVVLEFLSTAMSFYLLFVLLLASDIAPLLPSSLAITLICAPCSSRSRISKVGP
ncbi:hypothetical protein C8R45DRAFT_1024702 [Mycena sanguinolenta]|nr:hypothetical protein C8R45DRAFT_1024702 [Mycena sanguinolenta]